MNLCFSGLKSLDKISKLKCLKRLYLRHNEIDSFQEIRKLKKISSLSSLSLIGNPICQLENYRYFHQNCRSNWGYFKSGILGVKFFKYYQNWVYWMAKFWIRVNLDVHPSHQRKIRSILMKLYAFQSEFHFHSVHCIRPREKNSRADWPVCKIPDPNGLFLGNQTLLWPFHYF